MADSKINYPEDEDGLKRWIAEGIEESITLDYKGPASLSKNEKEKIELTKDVTAMANSAGGVLIYGVREYPAKTGQRHKPEKIEAVDGHEFTKEWLEQTINSRIKPRINGLRIIPIRLAGTDNGVVYVVEVPQSEVGHQADDKRYYRRYNFESVPMEDYEIRDLMGRAKHPQIELILRINEEHPVDILLPHGSKKGRYLNVYFGNAGARTAKNIEAFLYLPLAIMGPRNLQDYSMEKHSRGMDVACFRLSLGFVLNANSVPVKNTEPLLPGLDILLKKIAVRPQGEIPDNIKVGWSLFADEAPPHTESIEFNKYTMISELSDSLQRIVRDPLDLGAD